MDLDIVTLSILTTLLNGRQQPLSNSPVFLFAHLWSNATQLMNLSAGFLSCFQHVFKSSPFIEFYGCFQVFFQTADLFLTKCGDFHTCLREVSGTLLENYECNENNKIHKCWWYRIVTLLESKVKKGKFDIQHLERPVCICTKLTLLAKVYWRSTGRKPEDNVLVWPSYQN